MADRRWIVRAALVLGLAAGTGCRSRVAPVPSPGGSKTPEAAALAGASRSEANGPLGGQPVRSPTCETPPLAATTLRIVPRAFTITADDPGLQLLAEREENGKARDVTLEAKWTVEPSDLARIEPGGYLRPLGAGVVRVRAGLGGHDSQAEIKLEPRSGRSWDFACDIVPILTRAGCNTGSCHGKADGQNGFHLSLFGYDTSSDFRAVARDGAQRRLSRVVPEQSLLLQKATGRAAHGGGPRLLAGAPDYHVVLAWIQQGAPEQRGKTHGKLVGIEVTPKAVRLEEPGPCQFRVTARYEDGHERDVTRLAAYKVNDDAGASVTPTGQVVLLRRAETDLIVRYSSYVVSTRLATVINPGLSFDFTKEKRRNFIDDEVLKRLASLRVPPSPPASDAAFLRRASLDLTAEPPPPEQIRAFLADKDPEKRKKLIDRLIASHEFVLFWRIKLGDLLQISSTRQGNGAYRYQAWIDDCLRDNRPWDSVVQALLTAVGDPTDVEKGGPVNYAMDAGEANVQSELAAQRFLGLRLRCAQCHDHPFDVWTQDDYFGLAACFAKVERGGRGAMMGRQLISINPDGQIVHLRTGKPAEPRLLDGKVVKVSAKEDPRKALADWMTAPGNPYFARAMVNWTWAQLFGRGLVDPPDDMSRANPAVHPELLDALARHFEETKFDLRELVRTIASSETYGRSSATVPGNERDTRLFSHQLPRPLTAHQMADALAHATGVPNRFQNDQASRTRRAIDVPDPTTTSTILDTFGRCTRVTGCASTSSAPLTLRQALLLIGGNVIEDKISSLRGYLASVLKLELEPEELVENLYYRTVCRPPTAEESSRWAAELKSASSPREAAEDLFWALLNSREFSFNH
jgi:Protein of unknown function (DUF1553)/Protein of unknown function (DUF1549)